MAKNIKVYNESLLNENSENFHPDEYTNTRQLSVSLLSTESDSSMIYILFNILFVLQGARILTLGGVFSKYMDENSKKMSDAAFNSSLSLLIK